jgi:ADP-ribosylglycohydrolase
MSVKRRRRMEDIIISKKDYKDKVYGCWLGKNIGGTLGAPFEGQKNVHSLRFYDPLPDKVAPNDDLDIQLVWLNMMEKNGVPPKMPHFAEFWKKHLSAWPPDEYGFCNRNLDRGLMPPVSGWFENYFVDCMGAPIRSEIWACLSPANPQKAASLAWMDASMDHSGGEGVYGEMFWAAVESAAFIENNPEELIRIGLSMIPPSCRIARVIREALWCRRQNLSWAEARDRMLICFPGTSPTDAPQNHGFTVIGWLYGTDFGSMICSAVNCGYDTDCTGATLGALLGILNGASRLPARWVEPVGDKIIAHPFTRCDNIPGDVGELTERITALAEKMGGTTFGDKTEVPEYQRLRMASNEKVKKTLSQDINCARVLSEEDSNVEITLHYQSEPVIYPDIPHPVKISALHNDKPIEGRIDLNAPEGWTVAQTGKDAFEITAGKPSGINRLTATVENEGMRYTAGFVILGPSEARGFPGMRNVERCPKCRAYKQHCICKD